MQGTSNNVFSAHRDILDAPIPEDVVQEAKLLEELKNRGKLAVQAGSLRDAVLLYEKALQLKNNTNKEKAILNSNVSLCLGKMNQWKEAQEAAKRATLADASYLKGWWRLGTCQAKQNEYKDAIHSLNTAQSIDPANKALQKELDKLQEQQAIHQQEQLALQQQQQEEAEKKEELIVTKMEVDTAANPSISTQSTSSTNNNSTTTDKTHVDGTEFTKSDHVRGYKIVNGKKTSFFHNELTDEARELIGDIRPKKLDSAVSATITSTTSTTKGTSAWNTAGTWEEKDCTKWAQETLLQKLLETSYTLPDSAPAPGGRFTVTKPTKVTGTASVATVRGKKRYIYELEAVVAWTFVHNDNNTASGTCVIHDIDGTNDDYEIAAFEIKELDPVHLRPVVMQFGKQCGLVVELQHAICGWVELFKETY